jgi:glycosyltransferase involved in cell wall biosynthesis
MRGIHGKHNMNMPLVSICLPNLNTRRFLEPRMESLLSQTLNDWELIIVDNYSDDGAWEYFQKFNDDPRIKLTQAPRAGMYANWNNCLRQARGEYIYVATSDDTCKPELLEKMVAALGKAESRKQKVEIGTIDPLTTEYAEGTEKGMSGHETLSARLQSGPKSLRSAVCGLQSDPIGLQSAVCSQPSNSTSLQSDYQPLPADIAVCNFDYIDENGEIIDPPLPPAGAFYGDDRYRAHRRSGYVEFLVHLLIGTSWTTMTAVLFRRSLLEKTGLFVTDCGPLADRFWAYKSALHSDTIVVPETLATWRQHPQQGTSMHRKRSMRALRQLWRKTEAVIEECVPLMPEAWQQEPGFLEKLLWAERRHYYGLYCLSRTIFRKRFSDYALGSAKAAVLEPSYLVQRLLSGLAWKPDAGLGEAEYLRRLMLAWKV